MSLFRYLIESGLALVLLYLGYQLVVRRFTGEAIRSTYVYAATLIGFLLPVLPGRAVPTTALSFPSEFDEQMILRLWEFTLGDVLLLIYYMVAAVLLLRLVDRCFRVFRHLHRTDRLESDYYHFVQPNIGIDRVAFATKLLTRMFGPSPAGQVVLYYEGRGLRWHHFLPAIGMYVLRALFWFNPVTHLFAREFFALQRLQAERYYAAKTANVHDLLQICSAQPLRFDWLFLKKLLPESRPRRAGRSTGVLTMIGVVLVAGLLCFIPLPRNATFSAADDLLSMMASVPVYKYEGASIREDFIFYWGSHFSGQLSPRPKYSDLEFSLPRFTISYQNFQTTIKDEPLLATQTGPLFNRLSFDLVLLTGSGETIECAVLADSALPGAYSGNDCLEELLRQIKPGSILFFKNIEHGFSRIPNDVPNFQIIVTEDTTYDPTQAKVPPVAFFWKDLESSCPYDPINGRYDCGTLRVDLERLHELLSTTPSIEERGPRHAIYRVDVRFDRIIEDEDRRISGHYFDRWPTESYLWQYLRPGDWLRISFENEFRSQFILNIELETPDQ